MIDVCTAELGALYQQFKSLFMAVLNGWKIRLSNIADEKTLESLSVWPQDVKTIVTSLLKLSEMKTFQGEEFKRAFAAPIRSIMGISGGYGEQ